jgi:hypothetical protein
MSTSGRPVRVFISYAHGDREHEERVRDLWLLLRENGVDAKLDLPGAEERRDWAQWMERQVQEADRILVIASPAYQTATGAVGEPDRRRGVQFEARLIRDRFYADQHAGIELVLPVVLAGCSDADIPGWLAPATATHYAVEECTRAGADMLLRALTGQPGEVEPPLGPVPSLPPRDSAPGGAARAARPGLRTEVLIEVSTAQDGQVSSVVSVGGSPLGQHTAPLSPEVDGVWGGLKLPPMAATERMATAGRRLAGILLNEQAQGVLAGIMDRLPPGDTMEVVLSAAPPTRPASTSPLASPPPTLPTPDGDATCPSATKRSGTWRWPPGT